MHHQDNLGMSGEVPSGTLQLISSRNGIIHAEGNVQQEPVRLIQIWIAPNQTGGPPVYGTANVQTKGFNLLAAEANAPLLIRQKASLHIAVLSNEEGEIEISPGSLAYGISIGTLSWNGEALADGDGIQLSSGKLKVHGTGQALIIQQK